MRARANSIQPHHTWPAPRRHYPGPGALPLTTPLSLNIGMRVSSPHSCIELKAHDRNQTGQKPVINLMSHGNYSLYEPRGMMPENKELLESAPRQVINTHPFSRALFSGSAGQTP